MPQKIFAGRTEPGNTHWKAFSSNGLVLDVDTSAACFKKCPVYVTSLGGNSEHAHTVGVSNLYPPGPSPTNQDEAKVYPHGPTATGFRVYVDYHDLGATHLTPEIANQGFWHVNWIGIEEE